MAKPPTTRNVDASFFAVDASARKQFLDGVEEIAEANKLLALCDSKAVETALPVADEIRETDAFSCALYAHYCGTKDPAIRRRHWTRLSEELRALPGSNQFEESSTIDVHVDNKTLSLRLLLESGATKCMTQIREISAVAFKEYEIELALGKMEAEWREKCPDGKTNKVALTLVQYATRDEKNADNTESVYILGGVDIVVKLIADQSVRCQNLRCSPYAEPFIEKLESWETLLVGINTVLTKWVSMQRVGAPISIFTSEDLSTTASSSGATI